MDWVLLIYSLPSQPSRYRAYVWRELKRLGAVYLRDGVALLPRNATIEDRLREVVRRIAEYEGSADLILSPRFADDRDEALRVRFQDEREAEYKELYRACVRFLRDVLEEVSEEEFGFPDVDALESELGRLQRWQRQIVERDYFGARGRDRVDEVLLKCERAFERFVSTASEGAERDTEAPEDVFDRLGGPASTSTDLPL
jgi:hypothetical protein